MLSASEGLAVNAPRALAVLTRRVVDAGDRWPASGCGVKRVIMAAKPASEQV